MDANLDNLIKTSKFLNVKEIQAAIFSHFSQHLVLVIYSVGFLWRNSMESPL